MTAILSTKQPSEAYFISFDFANALGSETIESSTVAAVEQNTTTDVTDIVTDALKQNNTDTVVYVWVQAGTTGINYMLTCQVVGSSGSQYELDALLPVEEAQSDLTDYCQIDDITNQISEADMIALSDDLETGAVNQAVVSRAIADADAEINAYLYGKYEIPLSPVPDIIRKLSVDFTIYRLSGRRGLPVSEDRKYRYEEGVRMLKDIQKGIATIGSSLPSTSSSSGPISVMASSDRIFTMTTMANF